MRAKLYFGKVMHHRLRPAEHRFVYPVFFLRVPLSDPPSLAGPMFGVNRLKLFSFMFRDHGARDGSAPLDWIRALLRREGLAAADGEVWLQAFPRVLGFVFNPARCAPSCAKSTTPSARRITTCSRSPTQGL